MKIYQVGGSVRDELLGRNPKDIDYVVVGSTPAEMLALGYKQVGADFPVFLNDQGVEYALARTERKVGKGYNGFETDFNPNITLEDDLRRRDLTINAMAKDPDTGEIIDPFNGLHDLQDKILRHVSPAFAEDPLRVLRVCRFRARYGFRISPTTTEFMEKLVDSGELDHLTPERVWLELEKGLCEAHPNSFITTLMTVGAWERLFPGIHAGTCLHYVSMATDFSSRIMMVLASTPTKTCMEFLAKYKAPVEIIRDVEVFKSLSTDFVTKPSAERCLWMLKKIDAFRRPGNFKHGVEIYKLLDCNDEFHDYLERLEHAYEVMNAVTFESLPNHAELKGKAVGEAIDAERLARTTFERKIYV